MSFYTPAQRRWTPRRWLGLESCPGITTLALIGDIAGPHLLPAFSKMRIQRLSLEVGPLFRADPDTDEEENEDDDDQMEPAARVDLTHPLFATVTHLDVFDEVDIEDEDPTDLAWLLHASSLPALTHLSFNTLPNPLFLEKILANCPQLRVLMVVFGAKEEDMAVGYMGDITIADPRFVVATYADYYRDWEVGARGADDIWVRAEEFISRKRRGEIEEGDYFCPATTIKPGKS